MVNSSRPMIFPSLKSPLQLCSTSKFHSNRLRRRVLNIVVLFSFRISLTYAFSWRISNSVEVPSGIVDSIPRNYDFYVYGNVNDFFVDPSSGALTRRVTSNMIYRGVPTFSIYISVYLGLSRYGPCVSASFLLPEPFTRVEGELAPEQ